MNQDRGAPSKPSRLRQIIPWLFALSILAVMFHQVDFFQVWEALRPARAWWIIAAYSCYSAVYYLTDVLSFFRTYQWLGFGIGFAETARLRFASYAVQAINGAITEIMTVLYLLRVKKAPALQSASAAGLIYFNETATMTALLAYCAFALPPENRINLSLPRWDVPVWTALQAGVLALLVLMALWVFAWVSGLINMVPRWRDHPALSAFKVADLRCYAEIFFYRFSNNLVSVGANIVMLKALGIEAPTALLFAVVPVMVNVAYWPVSAGGFGGPQLAAHYLLKGYAGEEQVLAYSLVWSGLFFLTRSLTGLAFIRPVYGAAFPSQSRS
jgi:hypothetical protein